MLKRKNLIAGFVLMMFLIAGCATIGIDLRTPTDKLNAAAKTVTSINNTIADYYTMGAISRDKATDMRSITKEAESMIKTAYRLLDVDPERSIDLYELVEERLMRLSNELLIRELEKND